MALRLLIDVLYGVVIWYDICVCIQDIGYGC